MKKKVNKGEKGEQSIDCQSLDLLGWRDCDFDFGVWGS